MTSTTSRLRGRKVAVLAADGFEWIEARTVRVDKTIEEANPHDYDALLIPGGFVNPDFLRQSSQARNFVRAFDGPPGRSRRCVTARGCSRRRSSSRAARWITSRGPQDLGAFVPAMIEAFATGRAGSSDDGRERTVRTVAAAAAILAVGVYAWRRAA